MKRLVLAAVFLVCLGGKARCIEEYEARPGLIAPGGILVFMNSRGPLSFETMTPGEIPKNAVDVGPVKCSSCQHGLSIPITMPSIGSRGTQLSGAQGNGSFEKALENLRKERPNVRGIYDVKVDYHRISILGLYKRLCTEISARGFQ